MIHHQDNYIITCWYIATPVASGVSFGAMDDVEVVLAQQLAARLRELRRSRGWTQAVLAERANLTPHYIALVETARKLPTLGTLGRLAQALSTSPADLLGPAADQTDPWLTDVQRLAPAIPATLRPLMLGVLKLATRHREDRAPARKRVSQRERSRVKARTR